MNIPTNQNAYLVASGTGSVRAPVQEPFDPTSNNINYPQFQVWQNTITGIMWQLVSFSASNGVITANWSQFATSQNTVETLTGNSGGAVSPNSVSGNINVVGDGTTINIVGNPATNTLTASYVGSSSITIDGDTGSASGSTISIIANVASQNSGQTVAFTATGSTVTFNVTDASSNTLVGNSSGIYSTIGSNNTSLGSTALTVFANAIGSNNTAVGAFALDANAIGNSNTAIGFNALFGTSNVGNCTAVGQSAGGSGSGSYNISIGVSAGPYIGTEASNICIGNNTGTAADNHTIRIGNQGSGNAQQNTCYIAGITGVSVSNANYVTINTSTGQLGSVSIPSTGVTSISGTANQIAASASTGAVTLSLVGPYTPSSYTAYAVLCGGTTSTSSLQSVSGVGTSGQVLTSNGSSALPTWTSIAEGYSPTAIVVSPTAGQGNYTTIGAAITAATSGQTILIKEGTYTENITLKSGVNLVSLSSISAPQSFNVCNTTIVGKVSDGGGTNDCCLFGLNIQTNSDFAISVSGGDTIQLTNCYISGTNNTPISNSNVSGNINFQNCIIDVGTTGISAFTITHGVVRFFECSITNSGGSTTATTVSDGSVQFKYCTVDAVVAFTGTGAIIGNYSLFGATNSTSLTTAGNQAASFYSCSFGSGSASAISVGTGTTVTLMDCQISSSNTNAITGAGTLIYGEITFSGSSSTVNTSTQTPLNTKIGTLQSTGIALNGGSTLANYVTGGTWTPTIVGSGSAGTTTYVTQTGNYTRIGNVCFLQCDLVISGATGTGAALIGGLPFTPAQQAASGLYIDASGWTWPVGTTQAQIYLQTNGNHRIACSGSLTAEANMQMANAALEIIFSMSYLI